MALKSGDFIELHYTGKIKETGEVFDTTDAHVPHDHHDGHTHEPAIICLGHNQLLKGIDSFLIGKDIGTHHVDLEPEAAFGKRDSQLIQLIPTKKFLEQQIQPVPGGRVNVDGAVGTIRTVSGGRTIVDFNHPLAGRAVSYTLKVTRLVDKKDEQVIALTKRMLGIAPKKVEVQEGKATITLPFELPKELLPSFSKEIKSMTGVELVVEAEKKAEKAKDAKEHSEKKPGKA